MQAVGDEVRFVGQGLGLPRTRFCEHRGVGHISLEAELVADAVEGVFHRFGGAGDVGHLVAEVFAGGVLYLELLCGLAKARLLGGGLRFGIVYQTLQIGKRGCRNARKVGGVVDAELGGADLHFVPEAVSIIHGSIFLLRG